MPPAVPTEHAPLPADGYALAIEEARRALRPRRDWAFAVAPTHVIQLCAASPGTDRAQDLHRTLALQMETGLRRNARQLDRMATIFHIASVLLTIEILAWVVSIATSV